MTSRGFARGRRAARALSVVLLGAVAFGGGLIGQKAGALAQDFSYAGYDWFVDRAATGAFEIGTFFGRDDVLRLGILANTTVPSSDAFYQTEGYNTFTGLPVGSALISGDLYIPAGQATSSADFYQSIGLWPFVGIAPGTQQAFPIIQFYNGANPNPVQASTPGSGIDDQFVGEIRAWIGSAGGWGTLTGDNADPLFATDPSAVINYDDWNTLRVNYVSGEAFGEGFAVYILNGVVIGIAAPGFESVDPATASVYQIALNSRTNGVNPYDVYWSDLRTAMLVPGNTTRMFSGGTTYTADLEIESGGIAVGGTVAMPYVVTGDVENLGGTMAGNFDVGGNFFNMGAISPGNSPGIDNMAGNYDAGPNSEFLMEVDLSAVAPVAGTDYDQINIGGNVTGTTSILLFDVQVGPPPPTIPLSDTGPVVAIDDIDLVTIGGSGDLSNFILGDRYLRNGYDVLLDERSDGGTTTIGLRLETPPETYDLASVPGSAIAAGDILLGTYVDRRGLDWDGTRAAWLRGVGGTASTDNGSSLVDGHIEGVQFGLDLASLGSEATRIGVTAGYGRQSTTVVSPDSTQTGRADGLHPSVGAYLTHSGEAFYADVLAQYRMLEYDVSAPMTDQIRVQGDAFDVAAETGAKIRVSDSVVLIPFGQLLYQHVRFDGASAGPFDASFSDTDALIARARLLAQATSGSFTAFASAGVAADLLGDKMTTVSGLTLATNTGGARAEFTAGLEGQVGESLSVFGAGQIDVSFDGNSSAYLGRAGVRQEF